MILYRFNKSLTLTALTLQCDLTDVSQALFVKIAIQMQSDTTKRESD